MDADDELEEEDKEFVNEGSAEDDEEEENEKLEFSIREIESKEGESDDVEYTFPESLMTSNFVLSIAFN